MMVSKERTSSAGGEPGDGEGQLLAEEATKNRGGGASMSASIAIPFLSRALGGPPAAVAKPLIDPLPALRTKKAQDILETRAAAAEKSARAAEGAAVEAEADAEQKRMATTRLESESFYAARAARAAQLDEEDAVTRLAAARAAAVAAARSHARAARMSSRFGRILPWTRTEDQPSLEQCRAELLSTKKEVAVCEALAAAASPATTAAALATAAAAAEAAEEGTRAAAEAERKAATLLAEAKRVRAQCETVVADSRARDEVHRGMQRDALAVVESMALVGSALGAAAGDAISGILSSTIGRKQRDLPTAEEAGERAE